MMKGNRRSSAPPDVPTLFAQWKGGKSPLHFEDLRSKLNSTSCTFGSDRAVSNLPTSAERVQEDDESSEPSDFGSEPSSPPESDSEPEDDPPTDFDETPPESEFEDEDEPMSPPESFVDESFIDDSIMDESFIDDEDGMHIFAFISPQYHY